MNLPMRMAFSLAAYLFIAVSLASGASAEPSPPAPSAQVAQLRDQDVPPDGYMMVVASNQAGEITRWNGPIDLRVSEPTKFVATRTGKHAWTWDRDPPGPLRVDSPDRKQGGKPLHEWAEQQGANRVLVIVVPYPGEADSDATATGLDTHGRGQGHDAATARPRASPDEQAPWAPVADQAAFREGQRGTGTGQGSGGRDHARGTGTHASGTARGSPLGSELPSWIDNPRAEIAIRDGRTPADHGRRGGSASGEPGGSGHVGGAGWLNLLDVPERVAPIVAAALIVSDADVLGFGQKLFNRAVRGLARQVVETEIGVQAKAVVKRRVQQARARMRAARPAPPPSEHMDEIMDYMPEEVELAFYRELAGMAGERVRINRAIKDRLKNARDDAARYARQVATENHAAWREIEDVCEQRMRKLESAGVGASVRAPTAVSTPAHMVGSSGKGGLAPVLTGLRGEARVRAVHPIGERKMIRINGRMRVPDGVTEKVLTEVKNVKKLSFTEQLKDYLAISQEHGLGFDLFVRPDTKLSEPLKAAIEAKKIKLRHIP